MYDKKGDVASKLAMLQARFRKRALNDIRSVESAMQKAAAGEDRLDQMKSAYQTLHRLAGSAGTFGFHALGNGARMIELRIKPFVEGDVQEEGRVTANMPGKPLLAHVGQLRDLLTHDVIHEEDRESRKSRAVGGIELPAVLLIEPDEQEAARLASALAFHGFTVSCSSSTDLSQQTLETISVILVHVSVLPSLDGYPSNDGAHAPVLVIGAADTFEDQYRLASAGAAGVVTQPVDVPALADHIERLLDEQTEANSGRVMIVDDDPELLEHYGVVLEYSGLEVRKVNSPSNIFETLSEFRPDIVLMDVQMERYSGPVLARMLRFDPEWTGLHIIFLSSEEDREFQFDALSHGGDDFLTKPVPDKILVQATKVRCYRARQLDRLASRDSLTGLLKHSLAISEVVKEHARCQRLGESSIVAMVDLDHFKQVNDVHGHRVGDLVIKGLANLLRNRLRKTDIIGRYGGEEFLVALTNCSTKDARDLMQQVCDQLSQIAFRGETGEFHVTLSVGLAPLNGFNSPEKAIEAADRALYRRKASGRNGVTLISHLDKAFT